MWIWVMSTRSRRSTPRERRASASEAIPQEGPGSTKMDRPPVSETSQGVMKLEKPGIGASKDILLRVYSLHSRTVVISAGNLLPSRGVSLCLFLLFSVINPIIIYHDGTGQQPLGTEIKAPSVDNRIVRRFSRKGRQRDDNTGTGKLRFSRQRDDL